MKKINKNIHYRISLGLILLSYNTFGQQVSPTDNKPDPVVQTPVTVPYPGIKNLDNSLGKYNYIRSTIFDEPLQTSPVNNNYFFRRETAFYDGLGRPMQTVSRKAHADGNDIVNVNVYDALGNETYQYLPYAAPTDGVSVYNIGQLKPDDSSQMRGFYDHNGPDEPPYSQTIFENSPLNRPIKSMPPGKSWVGSGRGKEFTYTTNSNPSYFTSPTIVYTTTGNYPRFIIGNNNTDLPVLAGEYDPLQLYINKTKDEDGKVVEEIKDKDGHVIMKRSLLRTDRESTYPATGPTDIFPNNYSYTHYVYNDLGQLRAVIPPAALQPAMINYSVNPAGALEVHAYVYTWPTLSYQQVNGLCYTYFYDQRGRLVEKKVPGKGVDYYVYDQRDRMVMHQDGGIRPNFWYFTLYDCLDRPTMEGATLWPVSRQYIQNEMDDNSTFASGELMFYLKSYNLYHSDPVVMNNCTILKRNYYDDYANLTAGLGFDASQFSGIILPSNNTVVPSVLSGATKGLPTWSKSMVVDPDNYNEAYLLTTVNYYDANGRVIQTQSQGLNSSVDVSSNIYYFQGMLWKSILKHVNPAAVVIPGATDGALTEYTLTDTYERNLAIGGGNDLVKHLRQKINNSAEYELSGYSYDHLGRTTVKQWTAGLAQQEYSMRGFASHIAFRKYDMDTAFNENLYYDRGFRSKLFNGNIAGITWSGADHKNRAYGYNYDNLNRLTHAEFNEYDNNSWNKSAGYDFTASNITYDLNGNIKTMNQMAPSPLAPGSVMMDALTYTYAPASNVLTNVKDAANSYAGLPDFKDDLNGNATTVQEYNYDGNGNLASDINKGITSITYNIYNKAQQITVDGKGVVTYTYDAMGRKLRKKLTYAGNAQPQEIWDYMGNFVYKNNELQYILNEEGRARPMLASNDSFPNIPVGQHLTRFVYDYFVKDHLGNVRSTVTAKPNAYNYLALHNISTANMEELIFDNISNVRDTKPGSTSPDDMAARLNGAEADHRIGTAIMLATKPGDRLTFNVNAFYDGDYSQDQEVSAPEMLESLMGTLLGGSTAGPKPVPVEGLPSNQEVIRNIFSNPSLAGQLDALQQVNNDPRAPKAHLNYLWFDDKMQFQANVSGTVQIAGNPNNWTLVSIGGGNNGNTTVVDGGWVSPATGTLIVYIDNQSIGKDVWFDNLSIGNYESNVMEEDHYYPFGLTLNTTATLVGKNPYKYNGKELESKFGLEMYDYGARAYDPQIGRWLSPDPLAEQMRRWSPYNYAFDNPIRFIDPDGMSPDDYYDNGGHYLGSDGEGSDMRLIRKDDYNNTTNGGSAADHKDELRNSSRVITVQGDEEGYINNAYDHGETNHKEEVHNIILDIDNATLGFEAAPVSPSDGTNSVNAAPVRYANNPGIRPGGLTPDDATIKENSHKVIVGSLHPHPTPTNGNTLVSGVSVVDNPRGGNDLKTAAGINAPVYAVDRNNIHKVDQKGNITNGQPRNTKILKDALQTKGGKP